MDNELKIFSITDSVGLKETELGEIEVYDYVIEDENVNDTEEQTIFEDMDEELSESINYLFLKEYKAVLEATSVIRNKISNSINIYKNAHNIKSIRLEALNKDKYIDAIIYYASVYNHTPTIIRTAIGNMFLMERIAENPNYLTPDNFNTTIPELNKDLDILITIVLAEYRGSRLQEMHDRLGELLCIIERDKLNVDLKTIVSQSFFKEKDISINKEEEALFYMFKTKIFSPVLNMNYVYQVIDKLPEILNNEKYFKSSIERQIMAIRVLSIVRNNGIPWIEYHCYLRTMYNKMRSTATPHIVKSIYQNKSDIDTENNRIYAQCTCGEILDVTDMMFEFKFINKTASSYEDFIKEDKEELQKALNTNTFNQSGQPNHTDRLTESGYVYQHHIHCDKCGKMALFSKRNNILIQELLKKFLRSEEVTSSNTIREGYATLNPIKLFELDSMSDFDMKLDLAIDITDNGVNTNIFGDLDFSDFERVAKDFILKLEKKGTEKELTKGSDLQFNYGAANPAVKEFLEWFNTEMYQPEHIQYRAKIYRNFLLWFLKTNYTARFDSEALLMYGINYLYSGEIAEYNKNIVDYNKKLKNLRLSESVNKKMLEYIGVYNKTDDPDYQPMYDENDIAGNKQLFVDINRLNSFIQRALQIEVDRCFVNKLSAVDLENIHTKFYQFLEDFVDNTNRVSLRLNTDTKPIVYEKIKELILTEEVLTQWIDITTGNLNVDDDVLDEKIKDILKYVGGKQSDKLLDIDYEGLLKEKPKAPTLAQKPNGSSLMLLLNNTTIINLIIEIGKQEYLNKSNLTEDVPDIESFKPLFDKIIYGDKDDHNSVNESVFTLVQNRLMTLIKSYEATLEKYNNGDESIDIEKEKVLPKELVYFVDYMLSKVSIPKEYINLFLTNRMLTQEALSCDIVTIKPFKNKIKDWYNIDNLVETTQALITHRLEAQIYYQIKLNIFFDIQDKVYTLGKDKLLDTIYENFEGLAIALMEELPLQLNKPRCFGGHFSREWLFDNINPFKKNKNKQVTVEFYCRKGVPNFKPDYITPDKKGRYAQNVIWAFIKMMDINYFISELITDFKKNVANEPEMERRSLVNNLSSMLSFDKLFAEIYKLPITEISDDLLEVLSSADILKYEYKAGEYQLYSALVLNKDEIVGLEYLLGIKKALGYMYGKDTLLLNVIDKVQKINLSGTIIPYLIQNR